MRDKSVVATEPATEAGAELASQETAVPVTIAEDEWDRKNLRRSQLIHKEFSTGLTPVEEKELNELQAELARMLDDIAPISFDVVDELAAAVRRIEARHRKPAGPDAESPG
jgi:hypothetical protein